MIDILTFYKERIGNKMKTEQWNEKMAERYMGNNFYRNLGWTIKWIESNRFNKINSWIKESSNLLDVGCGDGELFRYVKCKEMTGIDLSKAKIEMARRQFPHICFEIGKAENLPFHANSFENIVCTEVLEHLPDPGPALKEMKRVCKDDGTVIMTVPNEQFKQVVKKILIKLRLFDLFCKGIRKEDTEWHLQHFSKETLINLLEKKFKIEKIEFIPFNWFPLTIIVKVNKK